MSEYFMEIEITPDEKALFTPIGADSAYPGDAISEVELNFDFISDKKSWSYGTSASTAPYLDRFFTFEFDDEHVFDIFWTYVDETDTDPSFIPHWYFNGVKYGTKHELICDAGECRPGEAELVEDPVTSLSGTYTYRVGDDFYSMTIR